MRLNVRNAVFVDFKGITYGFTAELIDGKWTIFVPLGETSA